MKNKITILIFFIYTIVNAEVLTISKAYELALQNANELKSTNYRYEGAKEYLNQEKSALYPQVNFSASIGKNDYELNHRQERADYDIGGDTKNYSLSVTQFIYNPKIKTKVKLEKSRLGLHNIKVKILEQDLADKVLASYVEVIKSLNKIQIYKSYVKYDKSVLSLARNKFNMNLENKMDILEKEVKFNSSKINLEKEKELLKVNKMQLKHLIGSDKYKFPMINLQNITSSRLQEMKNSIVFNSDSISNLKYQQAVQGVEFADKQITYAKSGHLPHVNIEAKYTKYDANDETAYYNNTKLVVLNINMPIYQGGYVKSKILSSKFDKQAADEDLLNIQSEIKVEYKRLLLHFDSSVKSIKLYKEAYASAQLYLTSVKKSYKSGLKSILDLNDAQNKLYDVKYKYMQNLYDMLSAYIRLLIITNNFNSLYLVDNIVK